MRRLCAMGRAFGADVSLTIHGPRGQAEQAIAAARATIAEMENLFSLYDPGSALSRLSRTGHLTSPPAHFVPLMQFADLGVSQSGGLFDPTVQPLWQALANGTATAPAIVAIGWPRVTFNAREVRLDAGFRP